MRLLNIFFGILLSFFVFVSCQKNIDFDEEITKPMVVLHSFLSPDTVVSARISLSRFFLDDTVSFKDINNADVSVIVNGALKEKMNLISNGLYQGAYRPQIGDLVKLVVKVPSMEEVSSVTNIDMVPVTITVDTTKIIHNSTYDISQTDTIALNTDFTTKYSLKFTDNGNEKNYYRLIVHSREHRYRFVFDQIIEADIYNRYYFDLLDLKDENNSSSNSITGSITGEGANANTSNKYNIFSDNIFNGKTNFLTFKVFNTLYLRYPSDHRDWNNPTPERIEVFVSLQSISKDYYYYLKSRNASGSDNFFSEPVQISNNIIGGIGFLGSYTSSNIVRFDLP